MTLRRLGVKRWPWGLSQQCLGWLVAEWRPGRDRGDKEKLVSSGAAAGIPQVS